MSTVSIDSRGYGKIYQAVMRDRDLPLISKSIYAYLCSYAGNGSTAFPKRDKIIRDLQINKDTFSKHLKTLIEDGYIARERTTSGNVYTILQMVPSYADHQKTDNDDLTDMLVLENVQAKGFGTVPKLLMMDSQLTAQAKAIYAYFASFAGAGSTAFPQRSTIARELNIGEKAYNPHFRLLVDAGYISVESTRKNGKYNVSIYHLADSIMLSSESCYQAMSPKGHDGRNGITKTKFRNAEPVDTPMSEKSPHGGKMLKTSPALKAMSEKGSSDKGMSDKTAHDNFGQPNINNSVKTNNAFKKKQDYNHQAATGVENKVGCSYTIEWVKEQIDYSFLQREAEALYKLKNMLGHFSTIQEQERFRLTMHEILTVLPREILLHLQSEKEEAALSALEEGAFIQLINDVAEYWEEIRCVKRYVAAAVCNLL